MIFFLKTLNEVATLQLLLFIVCNLFHLNKCICAAAAAFNLSVCKTNKWQKIESNKMKISKESNGKCEQTAMLPLALSLSHDFSLFSYVHVFVCLCVCVE